MISVFREFKMKIEYVGYILLGLVAICWFVFVIMGMIEALPYGIIGLVALIGFGLLFLKVLKDRLKNKEDNYYSKNVDK